MGTCIAGRQVNEILKGEAAMMHCHAVVWIDHHEAHVQSFTQDETERTFIKAHGKHRQVHHRKGSIGGAKAPEDHEFYARRFFRAADRMLP
jgi:hypothetical protein